MKKLIYLLVVLVLIAGLSSCKSKKHGVRRDQRRRALARHDVRAVRHCPTSCRQEAQAGDHDRGEGRDGAPARGVEEKGGGHRTQNDRKERNDRATHCPVILFAMAKKI